MPGSAFRALRFIVVLFFVDVAVVVVLIA